MRTLPCLPRRLATLVLAGAIASSGSSCAAAPVAERLQAPDKVWQAVAERPRGPELRGESAVVRLNKEALDDLLRTAPQAADAGPSGGVVVPLPMPDGTFARFRVVESSVVSPELAAAVPEIRTYTGQGIDDPTATTRFGWTPAGFHAIVIGRDGTVYIDPAAADDVEHYVSYRRAR